VLCTKLRDTLAYTAGKNKMIWFRPSVGETCPCTSVQHGATETVSTNLNTFVCSAFVGRVGQCKNIGQIQMQCDHGLKRFISVYSCRDLRDSKRQPVSPRAHSLLKYTVPIFMLRHHLYPPSCAYLPAAMSSIPKPTLPLR
jgi:hypothetical protein